MKNTTLLSFLFICIINACSGPASLSQWRGPNRDGIYPGSDLLAIWPENGPEMIWSYEGLGAGHGNVGIGKNSLFICGMPDTTGVLYAFNFAGDLLWKTEYGEEWHQNYQGSRTTPTVIDGLVYLESGQGIVYCYEENSGNLVWSLDILKKFSAENIQWGMAESLLIDGDLVFCTPGGTENNVVALNRFDGSTVWTSKGSGQPAAYCSPILVEHNSTKLLVTMMAESIIGIDATSGESYWIIEHQQSNKIHANTPIYYDGRILCSSASAKSDLDGTVQIILSEDGRDAEVKWRNQKVTNLMNGFILKDGYLYSSPYNKSRWHCLDWDTGEIQYTSNAFDSGPIIYADGLFYCYSHKGEMALVEADHESFNVISTFIVPLGTKEHWSHPVINDGRLYIRHGNALMVYNIAEK